MNSALRQFLVNAGSWFAANLSSRLVASILFLLLTRFATLADTGAYTLATTFLALAAPLTAWGFDHLLIREVSRDPQSAPALLARYIPWRVGLTVIAYALVVAAVLLLDYTGITQLAILIASIGLFTDGVAELLQAYLVATEHSVAIVQVTAPVNVVRLFVGGWILINGGGAVGLALVLTLTSIMKCTLFVIYLWRKDEILRKIRLAMSHTAARSVSFWQHIKTSLPFVSIDIAWIVEFQIAVVLLSVLLGEEAVGVYGSAIAIMAMLLLVAYAFMMTIFPVIARLFYRADPELHFVYEKSVLYMALTGLLIAATLSPTAGDIYALLYPPTYAAGGRVLAILLWSLIPVFIHAPVSRLMIVADQQRALAMFIAIGAVLNLALNWLLIPHLGVEGAAIVRLISTTTFIGLNFFYVNTRLVTLHIAPRLLPLCGISAAAWLTTAAFSTGYGLLAIVPGAGVFIGLSLAFGLVKRQDLRRLQNSLAK